ncbi:MAG: hypothetical protein A3K19_15725 [Lentisphaerae bacterium RIFOXYB12_FULL_65_16]|nr:MAG: hypothetical protein A3K18_28430 [Lentisphaerae bacterium RIFOXYA12_64_32]OGV87378.1 MAG: hypothetical protein A3K19_15725 [Lentisphaerae bacterium RIFOXYB12_FULL_65_16]
MLRKRSGIGFKRHLKAGLFLCFVTALTAQLHAQVTVKKSAAAENPGVYVASFNGPEDLRRWFVSSLQRCDWFTVAPGRESAEYVIDCASPGGTPPALDVQVSSQTAQIARFRVTAPNMPVEWVAYRAVDKVIESVFRKPGLCASRIAFAVGSGGRKEVFTCNFDGTSPRQVTRQGTIATEPSWGPGATAMVYTLYENNATTVVLADMTNQRQRRMSVFPGLNSGAALSPDGRWAAVCLSPDSRVDLFLLEVASGRLHRLTNDAAAESSPCWSPDGTRICFVSGRAGRPQLFITPARGGTPTRIQTGASETVSPDWSRTSNTLCFSMRMGKQYALGVLDLNSRSPQTKIVTNAAGDWESPSWAPDGRHVVCSQTTGHRRGLFMVDTWYGRINAITQPQDHSLPSWSDLF